MMRMAVAVASKVESLQFGEMMPTVKADLARRHLI
jgi:hypothetical protein